MSRTYAGQIEGQRLVAWLNQYGGKPEGQRVIELLGKINAVEAAMVSTGRVERVIDCSRQQTGLLYQPGTLHQAEIDVDGKPVALTWVEPSDELGRAQMEINKVLEELYFFPCYSALKHPGISRFYWSTRSLVGEAVLEIMRLGEQGLLDRVRLCAWCKVKWFYARFVHQQYCSVGCQMDANYKTDEWRAHRREYLRRYRARKRREKAAGRKGKKR